MNEQTSSQDDILPGLDELISLSEAAKISGLSHGHLDCWFVEDTSGEKDRYGLGDYQKVGRR
jgi:hypothetical protein